MTSEPLRFRVAFDPSRYSQRVLALILNKSEEWGCSPLEAEMRLLDELAVQQEKQSVQKGGDAA